MKAYPPRAHPRSRRHGSQHVRISQDEYLRLRSATRLLESVVEILRDTLQQRGG